jgi:Na+/proline symporter
MALREDQLLGLYIAIPLYFVLLTGAAIWARKRTERLVNDKVTDQLSAHFLGGQSFGPILTVGTTFASIYSGYTVVGIPNEAYNFGWEALRWLPWFVSLLLGYFGTALRLRKASNIRNHQTPVDFITDRYQSQVLRYTIVFLQTLPALIFLSAQVAALRNSFNAMFNLPPDAAYPVVIMMIIILLFEWAGGLTSVALTDSVQAVVMIFSFVTLPTVMSIYFSPWSGLDSSTYPKPEFYNTISSK